jgi:hypothetical protein
MAFGFWWLLVFGGTSRVEQAELDKGSTEGQLLAVRFRQLFSTPPAPPIH